MREALDAIGLDGLIAEAVSRHGIGNECSIGRVVRTERDASGCNWRIAFSGGAESAMQVARLGVEIEELRARYILVDENQESFLTTWASRPMR